MTLPEFLLARTAEDEAAARACDPLDWPVSLDDSGVSSDADRIAYFAQGDLLNRATPAHVLAECEAKRRIVEWATPVLTDWPGATEGARYISNDGLELLRILAAVYADHPDYLPDWKS